LDPSLSLEASDSTEQQRLKVSEYLHDNMIKHLRKHLGDVLEEREKVTILIDNLDKSWSDDANLKQLSELLFSLLNVVHKITDDFQKISYKDAKVNLSLIVFLRSDIFSRIRSYASERDKIPIKHLNWSEPNLLFKIIENRINYSISGVSSPSELWNDYFCKEVDGVPLKEFVTNLILPRPRDIIFLFKAALQEAVNRSHSSVKDEDFKSAAYSYSDYAIQSLFPENGGRIKDLESIFYEFAGEEAIITIEELERFLEKSSSQNVNEIINILCEMTFIGQEVGENIYEYYSDKRSKKITNKLAEKFAEHKSRSKRFKINPAFHAYLGIEK